MSGPFITKQIDHEKTCKMTKRKRNYWLYIFLQDPQEMAEYLRTHLQGDGNLSVVKNVAKLEFAVEQCIKVLEGKSK